MSLVQLFIIPVIYALDIFSGEMSNRTIQLLFKIPIERSKIFFSKYLVSILGMAVIFIATSTIMVLLGHGREEPIYYFIRTNLMYGISAILLFTWFTVFGCQSRSEAGSLSVMFAVFIGWGIVLFWADVCNIIWPMYFVPYGMLVERLAQTEFIIKVAIFQCLAVVVVLGIACFRYASIRRYL